VAAPSTAPPGGRPAWPLLAAGLALVGALFGTYAAWKSTTVAAEADRRATFEYRVREVQERVGARMGQYERALRGIAGLFAATPTVDRTAFGRYVAAIRPEKDFHGIQAIGFQQLVPGEELDRHVEKIRADGVSAYSIRPEGHREVLAPIVFIEPFEGQNLRALGFDPLADPTRREALEAARDRNEAVLSGKVNLVQEPGGETKPGVVLYLPVYRRGSAHDTVERRRASILGWVYVAFRVGDVVESLLAEHAWGLDVDVYDGTTPTIEGRLYDPHGMLTAAGLPAGSLPVTRTLEVAGRKWTLVLAPEGGSEGSGDVVRPRTVAVAGVVVSMLVAAVVLLLATRAAESGVRAAATYTRSLIEASPDPLVTINPAGKITDVNAATEEITGFSRDRLVGTDFADSFADPAEARAGFRRALDFGTVRDHPLLVRHADGRTTEVLYNASVYRGPGGGVEGVIAAARDVTQLRAVEAKLAQASRLAALGTLVAGVAHEINNPLAAELSDQGVALEMVRHLQRRLAGEGPIDREVKAQVLAQVGDALEEAQEAGQRIASIVRDMAALATPNPRKSRAQVARVVADALRQLPPSVSARASIETEDLGAPDVLVAGGQIQQVIVNLVTNAVKAYPPESPASVRIRLAAGSAGTARLEVIDAGGGIDPSIRDRIFDPFFTTRPTGEGRGTGLGLAICHAIVTGHGGTLTVESEVGKGSRFILELPSAPGA
jgi:PAS domain S-box-containing protein